MQRHVIDRPQQPDNGQRLQAFMRILRGNGGGANPRRVHARGTDRQGLARMRHFLRIDRGGTA